MSIIPNINNEALQLLPDIALWKQQIADAINERGGNANPNSAFTQLAQDIEDISNFPTTGFEYISEIYRPRTLMEAYVNRANLITVEDNNTTEINVDDVFYNCTRLQSVQLSNLVTISRNTTFYNCTRLQSVQLPNLVTISGNSIFSNCTKLQSLQLPNLVTISGDTTFYRCTRLQSLQLPNLATISNGNTFSTCTELQSVQLPNLIIISGGTIFNNCHKLQLVIFGTLIECSEPFHTEKPNIRNVTIGQDTNINLPFQKWTSANVIAEGQSGIDELNNNLYNNLLTKLYDHSGDGETRILQIGWLDYVTPENIAYATAKGWTLTT